MRRKARIHKQVMILELLADGRPRTALEISEHVYGGFKWWGSRIYVDLSALEDGGYVRSAWEEGPRPRRRLYTVVKS